jgi:BirA family biotin operon repressor/biotin-[acetyl-CoA-carboxylase] ligase
MDFALGPRAAQAGYRILHHHSLDSTSDEAMRLARAGERGPLWVVADEQTAGRGRRGRAWLSVPGNLTASVLTTSGMTPAEAATLGFAAGLAVFDVCSALAPRVDFTLKWPNDVLANGRKIAGLLLESERRDGALAIVAGIGANLAGAPAGLTFPATSFAELGVDVAPQAFFTALTDAWIEHCGSRTPGGFQDVRLRWMEEAHGLGDVMSVRIGDRVESGVFEMIDRDGRLVLRRTDGSTALISAGDVYFGDAATAGAGS